jgi:transposase
MTKPFSLSFRQKMVDRMTGSGAVSATQLARETGIRQQTLSRWLLEARTVSAVAPRKRQTKPWTLDEKIRVLGEASGLTGEDLGKLLVREGLSLAELEQWRVALDDEARASGSAMRRIRQLERELARKEKALAEAAALLVLKKKVEDLWEDEDDGTNDESEK